MFKTVTKVRDIAYDKGAPFACREFRLGYAMGKRVFARTRNGATELRAIWGNGTTDKFRCYEMVTVQTTNADEIAAAALALATKHFA